MVGTRNSHTQEFGDFRKGSVSFLPGEQQVMTEISELANSQRFSFINSGMPPQIFLFLRLVKREAATSAINFFLWPLVWLFFLVWIRRQLFMLSLSSPIFFKIPTKTYSFLQIKSFFMKFISTFSNNLLVLYRQIFTSNIIHKHTHTHTHTHIYIYIYTGPVGWGCRIHRLHLSRGVRPQHTLMSVLDMTLKNLMVRLQ